MKAQSLKNAILQLAVQGKLVPQNEQDESAHILIQKIKAEKTQLIKDKKIKGEKQLPPITDEKKPFDIPNNWEWARLGSVLEIARGGSPRPISSYITEEENGINWIKISDSDIGGKYINSTKQKIKRDGLSKSRYVEKGDFLLTNSMSYGRPYILNTEGCIHDGWLVLSGIEIAFDKDFLYYLLCSRFIFNQFASIVSGGVVKNLNSDKVALTYIPLPPIAEQKRIVERIEQLMPLVDSYDYYEKELSALEVKFPQDLKKSVLKYAIQGKLVAQDESDEPASVLLQKIKARKVQLIKDKKIKAEKPLPPITDEEKPFDIPDTWEWVRLADISFKIGSGSTPTGGKTAYVDEGIKFIRSQNVYDNGLSLNNVAYISDKIHEKMSGSFVCAKDILLNITGGSIGRCAVIPNEFDTGNINQHVMIIRLIDKAFRFWVHCVLTSNYIQKLIMDVQVGVSREGLSATKIKHFLIPIPPIAEQQRIVEKVESLLALCDTLIDEGKLKKYQLPKQIEKVVSFPAFQYEEEHRVAARADEINAETRIKEAERLEMLKRSRK